MLSNWKPKIIAILIQSETRGTNNKEKKIIIIGKDDKCISIYTSFNLIVPFEGEKN